MKLRNAATRGIENISCPPRRSDQRAAYSASPLSIQPRACLTAASNRSRIAARDVPVAGLGGVSLRSYDESFRIGPAQFGRWLRCVERSPSDIDLSCGFHASLS